MYGIGSMRKNVTNSKISKWIPITVVTILVAGLFAVGLPGILKWVNTWKWLEGCTYFWITDDIEDWFAFHGSFIGVLVSIVMTIITLRLTIEIEESNQRNTTLQNLSTLIMNVPYMYCVEAKLSSLSRGDVLENYRDTNSPKEEYTFYFEMDTQFPTYFDVIVENIGIELPNKKNGGVLKENYPLSKEQYETLGSSKFCFFINMPEIANDTLDKLYRMDLLNSVDNDSVCRINIGLKLINKLYLESDGVENKPIKLNIGLLVENEGTSEGVTKNKKRFLYRKFSIIRTQMKRIE